MKKKILLILALLLTTLLSFVGMVFLFNIVYTAGQIQACESSLKLNPIAEKMKLYCEYEQGDVWLKSMTDMKSRVSMTTGELQVSD